MHEKGKVKRFANTPEGFAQLSQWLKAQGDEQASVCLEATRTDGHAVGRYLQQQGYRVSIVNPLRIKGFAQSQLSRTQNDRADALLNARYHLVHRPAQWQPLSAEQALLQQQGRQWQAFAHRIEQECNRLEAKCLRSPQTFHNQNGICRNVGIVHTLRWL